MTDFCFTYKTDTPKPTTAKCRRISTALVGALFVHFSKCSSAQGGGAIVTKLSGHVGQHVPDLS